MTDVICPKCNNVDIKKYYHHKGCGGYVNEVHACNRTIKYHFVNKCQICNYVWVGPAFNHKTGIRESEDEIFMEEAK